MNSLSVLITLIIFFAMGTLKVSLAFWRKTPNGANAADNMVDTLSETHEMTSSIENNAAPFSKCEVLTNDLKYIQANILSYKQIFLDSYEERVNQYFLTFD